MKHAHKNKLIHRSLIADIIKKLYSLQERGKKLLAMDMEILVRKRQELMYMNYLRG